MSYIENTLLKDEKIIFITRPHWIIFAPAFAAFIITLFILQYGPSINIYRSLYFSWHLFQWVALAAGLSTIYYTLRALIIYKTSEYGITDKRIMMKTGWIQLTALEIFLDKIEGVSVDQTILGRIIGYGTIIIIGTGGTRDPFYNVPTPLNFRRLVQQQIDLAEKAGRS